MKSVTIYNKDTKEKLIKIFKRNGRYFLDARNDINSQVLVMVIDDNNKRVSFKGEK